MRQSLAIAVSAVSSLIGFLALYWFAFWKTCVYTGGFVNAADLRCQDEEGTEWLIVFDLFPLVLYLVLSCSIGLFVYVVLRVGGRTDAKV